MSALPTVQSVLVGVFDQRYGRVLHIGTMGSPILNCGKRLTTVADNLLRRPHGNGDSWRCRSCDWNAYFAEVVEVGA